MESFKEAALGSASLQTDLQVIPVSHALDDDAVGQTHVQASFAL
jgi:hypothetical protein